MEKLKELFEKLKQLKEDGLLLNDDLVLQEPSVDDKEWNICCEQKIIYLSKDKFLICGLYGEETLQFYTIAEVVAFYKAYAESFLDYYTSKNKTGQKIMPTPEEQAANVGIHLYITEVSRYTEQFYKNAVAEEQRVFGEEVV